MEGRVVAVTGGASGIGLATAKLLASRGAKVSIGDVASQDSLDAAVASIKEESAQADVLAYKVNVGDATQVTEWLKATVEKFGRLDHAANVAGIWRESKLDEEEDDKVWDLVIGVNLTGPMHVVRESLKHFQNDAGCSIVNVASVAGIVGLRGQSAYTASKHGLVGLTRSVAKDVGPRGIRVNCVAPGVVETPLLAGADEQAGNSSTNAWSAKHPIDRRGDPIELAKVIAFLLSGESSFVTGSVYAVDGGYTC